MAQKKNASPDPVQYTQEQYLRRMARVKLVALLIVAAAAIAVPVFLWQSSRVVTGGIGGTYLCQPTESAEFNFTLELDSETGTYLSRVSEDEMGGGRYRVSGDHLTTTEKSTGEKNTYDVWGDYLLSQKHYYDETVPDGETFDAELTQKTDDYTVTLTFAADGTYTSSILAKGSQEPAVTEGTYTREGDRILRERKEEDGGMTAVPDLLVREGRVNSYFYQKTAQDEKEAEK